MGLVGGSIVPGREYKYVATGTSTSARRYYPGVKIRAQPGRDFLSYSWKSELKSGNSGVWGGSGGVSLPSRRRRIFFGCRQQALPLPPRVKAVSYEIVLSDTMYE